MTKNSCPHEEFAAQVNVNRLLDGEGGSVTGFMAEITVTCQQCRTRFQFLGPEVGLNPRHPTVSPHRDELRVPLAPHDRWSPSLFPAVRFRKGDS